MDSDLLIRTRTFGSVRQELSQSEKKGLMKDAVMKIGVEGGRLRLENSYDAVGNK
jgi:hypothetical protein